MLLQKHQTRLVCTVCARLPQPELSAVSNLVACERTILCFFRLSGLFLTSYEPFPKQQILDSSKLKVLADNNFKFDENGIKFLDRKYCEKKKLLVAISFPHCVFKRLVMQTHKNQSLFGKGLTLYHTTNWTLPN